MVSRSAAVTQSAGRCNLVSLVVMPAVAAPAATALTAHTTTAPEFRGDYGQLPLSGHLCRRSRGSGFSLVSTGLLLTEVGIICHSARASPRSFVWGGGDGFIGTQTHLSPKFSFFSDFGHFILKIVENAKLLHMSRKKMLQYPVSQSWQIWVGKDTLWILFLPLFPSKFTMNFPLSSTENIVICNN